MSVFLTWNAPFNLSNHKMPGLNCNSNLGRCTQQTVSVNNCSEDLLPLPISVFFSLNFRDMENAISVVFGEIQMSFWVRKKANLHFRKGNSNKPLNRIKRTLITYKRRSNTHSKICSFGAPAFGFLNCELT